MQKRKHKFAFWQLPMRTHLRNGRPARRVPRARVVKPAQPHDRREVLCLAAATTSAAAAAAASTAAHDLALHVPLRDEDAMRRQLRVRVAVGVAVLQCEHHLHALDAC